jgi:hypothetical protein
MAKRRVRLDDTLTIDGMAEMLRAEVRIAWLKIEDKFAPSRPWVHERYARSQKYACGQPIGVGLYPTGATLVAYAETRSWGAYPSGKQIGYPIRRVWYVLPSDDEFVAPSDCADAVACSSIRAGWATEPINVGVWQFRSDSL